LVTGGGIINYIVMSLTYIFFYRAVKAQGLDRKQFAYTGWFQPYSVSDGHYSHFHNELTIDQAYIGLGWMIFIILFYGYSSFRPWSVQNFFIYYTMLILGKNSFPDEPCRIYD
jgi:amino acid transporter